MATIQEVNKAIRDGVSVTQAIKELRDSQAKELAETQLNKEFIDFMRGLNIPLLSFSDSKEVLK